MTQKRLTSRRSRHTMSVRKKLYQKGMMGSRADRIAQVTDHSCFCQRESLDAVIMENPRLAKSRSSMRVRYCNASRPDGASESHRPPGSGDGATDLEHAMVSTRAQVHLAHCRLINDWLLGGSTQCSRISAGPISALQVSGAWQTGPPDERGPSLPGCELPQRIRRGAARVSQSTRGTSMLMSIRSRSGPEMRWR